jgi:hypothetical protein
MSPRIPVAEVFEADGALMELDELLKTWRELRARQSLIGEALVIEPGNRPLMQAAEDIAELLRRLERDIERAHVH